VNPRAVLWAFAISGMVWWPGAARADFAEGLRAFDAGDYAVALQEWRPLAEAGEAEAQVALAGLYMGGLGVPADAARAARWYERAARQGHAMAQLNLGDLYARGLGVGRDLTQAYLWLGLAAKQGRSWAAGRRQEIAREMSPAQIGAAEQRLRDWRPGQ